MVESKRVMKHRTIQFFLSALLIVVAAGAQGGILTISGIYQGKNLYVQNPFDNASAKFCTNEVYVNDVKITGNWQASAFEVELSNLKLNDPVTVKITHRDDCKPKILNPQVIRASSSFAFNSFTVEKSSIVWSTKGERPKGKFFLEHFLNSSWVIEEEITGKGSGILNNYDVASSHHSGLNKYRVKYLEVDGQVFYSKVFEFMSDLPPIDIYPKRVTDVITLSREADYEVLDGLGNMVRKGTGKTIDLGGASEGVYYVLTDNNTFKIYKK